MKWSKDRSEATGMSKMTVKFGKQKASLKCFLKYIANQPPATAGGSISLEEVEYKGITYKRSGGSVTFFWVGFLDMRRILRNFAYS